MALVVAILLAFFILPSPWGVVAVVGAAVWEVGEAWFMIRWTQRRRAQVGAEALIGRTAKVVVACAPRGQVAVNGERWQALCPGGANVGDTVVIQAIDGLVLQVEPAAAASAQPS
jgi:membrane protein implicated in regulation of membrane protease activity